LRRGIGATHEEPVTGVYRDGISAPPIWRLNHLAEHHMLRCKPVSVNSMPIICQL
jgi:hypothetical protein